MNPENTQNTKSVWILIMIVVLVAVVAWFAWSRVSKASISVNTESCTPQQSGTYICPAEALDDFGPFTVEDTSSGNTCTVSYDKSEGFSFDGSVVDTEIPPGNMAVSLLSDGSVSNLATTGISGSIAMHVRTDGTPDHVLTVNPANQTEQCFDSN